MSATNMPFDKEGFLTKVNPGDSASGGGGGGGGSDPNTFPALQKEWQFAVNQSFPAPGTLEEQGQNIQFGLKEIMIGFASEPWTVQGSSDSVAAAMDGVDRWTAPTDLTWDNAGSDHSWIVLQQDGIAPGFQICVDLSEGPGQQERANLFCSPAAGFTGGSITDRPTATDEFQFMNNASWGIPQALQDCWLHVLMSSDGAATRVFITYGGICTGYMMYEQPGGFPEGWAFPHAVWASGTNIASEGFVTQGSMAGLEAGRLLASAGVLVNFRHHVQGSASDYLPVQFATANPFDGLWDLYQLGYASVTVTTEEGRYGYATDIWFGSVGLGTSDNYPADGSRQFMQFVGTVVPWNGEQLQTGVAPSDTSVDARVEQVIRAILP